MWSERRKDPRHQMYHAWTHHSRVTCRAGMVNGSSIYSKEVTAKMVQCGVNIEGSAVFRLLRSSGAVELRSCGACKYTPHSGLLSATINNNITYQAISCLNSKRSDDFRNSCGIWSEIAGIRLTGQLGGRRLGATHFSTCTSLITLSLATH